MTDDQRLERVMELLEEAHGLPVEQRDPYLKEACGDDPELYAEVVSLLQADAGADGFMKQPVIGSADREDPWVGKTLGSYRIIEILAAGGMGVVYRAEQEHPRRQVALKLIRSGAVSEQLLRRFELEAEVLGRLDHPGIAQIFEASTLETDTGPQPFFAMELIDGPPLNRFAEERELRIEARLELLIKVCEAVNHAHRRGVIHRDLKPANILVREDGQPKVLDFGVARITDADVQVTTMHTDLGQIIGTLAYMSPEQVRGNHEELDLRSDVYTLGVLGYELLTGRLPQTLSGKSISEAARIIELENPSTLGASGQSFAPDLETIIGKCLEKEKDRRYGSAAELAADLRRFLNHEPISARPPSLRYQFMRFARRNRGLVSLAGLALAALVTGLVISLAGWSSTAKARSRAETEAQKSKLLNTYLSEMLEAPDPWADGREVKVVELLERASRKLDETLGDQPEVAAQAHHRLGYTYHSLGLYDEAELHLVRAMEISDQLPDFPLETRADLLLDFGNLHLDLGELDEAEQWIRKGFDLAAENLGEDHPTRVTAYHELALVMWEKGNLDEAERLLEECLRRSEAVKELSDEDTITTMAALGNVYRQQGKREQARPLLEEAYSWFQEEFGDDHPRTAIALNNLAFIYQELEQHEQALKMFRKSLESRRRVHGDQSQSVVIGLHNLGMQLTIMDRAEEAVPCFEEAIHTSGEVIDDAHWLKPWIHSTYGRTLVKLERYQEAEKELLTSLAGVRAILGDDHWRTRKLCKYIAGLYAATGDKDRAKEYLALSQEGTAAEPTS
jgi:serine/threonine protein kinase/Tfp pilus assembly protein PilF